MCAGRDLYYVSYVYGDGLKHANGRCLSYPGELEKLRAKHDEFDRYVVEVCTDCRWNHLGARELHGPYPHHFDVVPWKVVEGVVMGAWPARAV